MTKRIIALLILLSVSASATLAGFPRSSLERLVRVRRADVTFVYNFGTEWELTEGTEAGRTITLPLPSGYIYDFIVDWGDGTQGSVTAHDDADRMHTYATTGRKTVKIAGVLGGWRFVGGGDRLKFRAVTDWGTDTGFTGEGFSNAWEGCEDAESFATPIPAYNVNSLYWTWYNNSSLTVAPDISALTNVNSLFWTWRGCSSMTNTPDVSTLTKVDNLTGTWRGCTGLTVAPDVSALTNVTTLAETWRDCSGLTHVPPLPDSSPVLTAAGGLFRGVGSGMTGTVVAIWNAMEVDGFSDGNQKYHRNGTVNTKRGYAHNDLKIEWDGVDKWEIKDGATVLYESTDDVATPDLVTTWTAVSGGATIGTVTEGPFPNVTGFNLTFQNATGLDNYADIPDSWKGL